MAKIVVRQNIYCDVNFRSYLLCISVVFDETMRSLTQIKSKINPNCHCDLFPRRSFNKCFNLFSFLLIPILSLSCLCAFVYTFFVKCMKKVVCPLAWYVLFEMIFRYYSVQSTVVHFVHIHKSAEIKKKIPSLKERERNSPNYVDRPAICFVNVRSSLTGNLKKRVKTCWANSKWKSYTWYT